MIPTKRLLWFVLLLLSGSFAVLWLPDYAQSWQAWLVVAAAVCGFDWLTVMSKRSIQAERKVMHALSLGTWSDVEITLHNPFRYPIQVVIFDHHPVQLVQEGLPIQVRLTGQSWAKVRYRVKAIERGHAEFRILQVRLYSLLGLWQKNIKQPLHSEVKNYPNFASVMKYTLLATDHRLNQMGILKKRRRGEGLEFHQLREYRDGDSLRQVDWKATARVRKLISRDYQEERDQQIIFLVDCGRRMLAHDDELSHFDHTLNSILLLSHVALRQGDAVGLMTFSGHERWVPPRKSMGSVNTILNAVYDLQPSLMSPDYTLAATQLMKRQKRRALVILITNIRDEDSTELIPALHMLRKRHLVLLASMQESSINQLIQTEVQDFYSALNYASAQQYLNYRREAHQQIEQQGGLLLDVEPDKLPVSIVNRYLEIKTSGRL